LLLLLLPTALAFPVAAQDGPVSPLLTGTGTFLGETPPLRDLPVLSKEDWDFLVKKAERKMLNPKIRYREFPYAYKALPKGPDPAWQKEMGGNRDSRAPIQNFDGTDSPALPSDANGAIGPNHFMQTVNSVYTIYNRAGTIVAGPTNMNLLFYGVAGAQYNNGDPIVLFDEEADRWLAAEFSIEGSDDSMLVAVSTTNDPTGTWYKYSFNVDDTPDYEKFGIWRDGYYMGTNTATAGKCDIYVMERSKMLLGQTAQIVGFDNPWRPTTIGGFHCVPPLDNDGAFAPEGSPGLFITINDDAIGGGSDQLWIYELDVDWTTPANSTFIRTQQINVTAFDSNFGPDWSNITQQGTTQKLDAVPQVVMNPPQYRNFGSYETIVCCHTVDVNATDRAGIRWYELRRTSGGNWTIRQQGTYSPDSHSRWMGSIMLNGYNEIALGYSIASSTLYPGIRYCGQSAAAYASANSTMDVAESTIFTGTTYQPNYNRWGDYTSMQIDPEDDETFWYVNQYSYYTGSGSYPYSRKTKIANFQIGNIILTANFVVSNPKPQTCSPVTFTDVSFGSPASWSWSISPSSFHFINGTSSSSQNPQVQFTQAGSYSVTLIVSNGGTGDTIQKPDFIEVLDCGFPTLPFTEDFSDGVIPPCWKNIDNSVNGHVWQFNNPGGWTINTSTGANGCAILDSYTYGNPVKKNADLITPLLDLSAYTSVNVFYEHYFRYFGPNSGWGRLYYSINDGATWTQLGSTISSSLNGADISIDATTQVAGQSRVRFKWNFIGYGYYWAIDDISITGTGPAVWTGATSTDWATATNWSTGAVPTNATNVVIPKTATNWPTLSGDFTAGTTSDKITLYGEAQMNVNGNVNIPAGETLTFTGDGQISLTGNWTNQGNFIPGQGSVRFTGGSPSTVTTSDNSITNFQRSTFTKGMTDLVSGYSTGPSGNDAASNVNIGFTFNYLGTNYTQARICTNGWMTLNLTGSTSATNADLFTTTAPSTTLAPWFDDLTVDNSTSFIRYKTEGIEPYRVFTVEWKTLTTYRTTATARISFQVKLYETTNIIEFHYGTLTAGTHSGSESASAGLEDATGGPGYFIEATTGSSTTGISNLVSTTQWPLVNYRFSPPVQNFHHLVIDKTSSSLTLAQNSTIRGNLEIAGGEFIGPGNVNKELRIYGDWINNGTFTQGAGTVMFSGSSAQTIGGNTATNFYNLVFGNSAGFALQNNLTAGNIMTMTAGNIDCGADTLILGTSTSATGILNRTSGHIAGCFKRWIAASTVTSVDFPTGAGNAYRNARITFTNNTGGSLTARFEPGDPGNNSGFPLTEGGITINENNLYTEGSWTLTPTTLSSTNYALELTAEGFSTMGTPDETVRILKRTGDSDPWMLNGTHVNGTATVAKRSGLSGFSRFILAKPCNFNISGNITYYNQANTPLTSGITVKLYQNDTQLGTDYTVTGGTYQFTGLCPGTYQVRISSNRPVDGSINSTDAAQVNYWGVNSYEIEKVRFYAGDVTGGTYYINSTDALRIQANFVNGTSFDRPIWTFWKAGETINSNSTPSESYASVTISGGDITANIYGLCTGDFNRSFIPGARNDGENQVEMIHDGEISVIPMQEFELPVRVASGCTVGAVSLAMILPSDLFIVKDIVMMNENGQAGWAFNGDELRVGWFTADPVQLAAGDKLLTLKLMMKDVAGILTNLRVSLSPGLLNELADENFIPVDHAVVVTDEISVKMTGIGDTVESEMLTLSCYPNVTGEMTSIEYSIPRQGRVKLEISNIPGQKVELLADQVQKKGNHKLSYDVTALQTGTYFVVLSYESSGRNMVKSALLVVSR